MLTTDNIYFLDTRFSLYVWEGKKTQRKLSKVVPSIVQKFIVDFEKPEKYEVIRSIEHGEKMTFNLFVPNI